MWIFRNIFKFFRSFCNYLDLVNKMNNTLAHRGPDAEGIKISSDQKFILGHRRLSIIDLIKKLINSMTSVDKKVHLVFNGEIIILQN